jgi:hypothetical protein
MGIRKRAVTGLAVTAVVLAGACSDVPPTEPHRIGEGTAELFRAPSDPAGFSGGLDAAFVRLAEEIPGFGGLFYDEAGTLNVRMTGAVPMSAAEVGAALQRRLAMLGIPEVASARMVLREEDGADHRLVDGARERDVRQHAGQRDGPGEPLPDLGDRHRRLG